MAFVDRDGHFELMQISLAWRLHVVAPGDLAHASLKKCSATTASTDPRTNVATEFDDIVLILQHLFVCHC